MWANRLQSIIGAKLPQNGMQFRIGTRGYANFRVATAFALALASSACVPAHTWVPGPGATADFETTKGRCSLMARHSGSDFVAVGSESYVAGAAVGHAIGEANRTQADFNDCMSASGWRVADQQVAAAPAGAAQATARFGAFAYDSSSGKFGHSANQPEQANADIAAIKDCDTSSCKVVFRTGPHKCGALAMSGDGKVWGGATRDTIDVATAAALQNCQQRTANQCVVRSAQCNN
jgi:hypothetical protein